MGGRPSGRRAVPGDRQLRAAHPRARPLASLPHIIPLDTQQYFPYHYKKNRLMDLRIRKQKAALTAKKPVQEAVEQDPDLVVTPMTREMLIEQLNAGMEDIRQGRVYTTEEVIAFLNEDDD